jgi:hypothetical protein
VKQDYSKAAEWFRKAAEQGYINAQMDLGDCYNDGLGVTQNDAKAAKWYRKAAEQGSSDAQYALDDLKDTGRI